MSLGDAVVLEEKSPADFVDEAESEWVERMAGRRLKAPKTGKSRLSLPQWMLKSHEVRQKTCPVSHFSENTTLAPKVKLVLPALQPVLPQSGVASFPSDGGGVRRGRSSSKHKPIISLELQRKKKHHPRLRWLRLARGEELPDGSLGIIQEAVEAISGTTKEEDDLLVDSLVEASVKEYLDEDDLLVDVIGPDSLFYTGVLVPTAPQWPTKEWREDKKRADKYASPSNLSHKSSRPHGSGRGIIGGCTKAGSLELGHGPTLLSHVQPHHEVVAGCTATVHLPRLEGRFLDHRAIAKNGAASGTVSSDRKYHIRQAPVSHIMARGPDVSESGGSSSSPSAPRASPRRKSSKKAVEGSPRRQSNVDSFGDVPATEYLNFENWGIDDAYVELLCKRAQLDKIRFVNMSGNRLTDEGINFLLQVGEAPWALQSLQLAKNRLQERGGRAIARLLNGVRPPLRELDLSDNLIGDKACIELCEVLSSTVCVYLTGLTLARNDLGQDDQVGTALGQVVSASRELEVLDLHWNVLRGAGAFALLSGVYENNCSMGGKLRRLNLAWNRLGMRCGAVSGQTPRANFGIDGEGGGDFELSRSSGQTVLSTCSCKACAGCTRMAKMFSSIFSDGEQLFHLDLSYNGISSGDCSILGDGLKKNRTLFGLHLNGNDACVDELGFIIATPPAASKQMQERQDQHNVCFECIPSKMRLDRMPVAVANINPHASTKIEGDPASPKALTNQHSNVAPELGLFGGHRANPSLRGLSQLETMGMHPPVFSQEDLQLEKSWVAARTKAQQPLDFATNSCEDVRRDARCCWICENWVEQRVSYIPGWSGPEISPDEVVSVLAFFSVDGFTTGTKLTRIEEPFHRRLFDAERKGHMHKLGLPDKDGGAVRQDTLTLGRRPAPCLTEEGRIVRWTGSRMLPPTALPMHVVFQVNDRLVTADDLPTKNLPAPKAVKVGPLMVETTQVNTMCVGATALDHFLLGEAHALIILEDPVRRGQINVVPRTMQEVAASSAQAQQETAWSFENSIFATYPSDLQRSGAHCLEYDWKLSKIENFVKDPDIQSSLFDFLEGHYNELMMAHRHYAFCGFKSLQKAPGVLLLNYTEALTDYGGNSTLAADDPRKFGGAKRKLAKSGNSAEIAQGTEGPTLFNRTSFQQRDADTAFIAANVMDKDKRRGLMGMPEKGLARFQFMEAFVRVAQRRYQDSAEVGDITEATKALWDLTNMGKDLFELRQSLQKQLFSEECDMVYKEYRHMLDSVFGSYKHMHCYFGRSGKGITLAAWGQLCQDADVLGVGISAREISVAFALGKDLDVDEYTSMHHMELSWTEFLACLGAITILRADYESEFFADMLADFFADHISIARQGHLDGETGNGYAQDEGIIAVLELVRKVFTDADDDESGSLSLRKFRRAMGEKKVQQEMRDIGIPPEELGTFFSKIDRDGSGEVSLDELCEGFMKLKLSLRGVDRAVAYFRKAFQEADADDSGTLSMHEVRALTSNPRVLKKLAGLGVAVAEVDALVESLSMQGSSHGANTGNIQGMSLTADDMIAGFLTIRESGLGESRGVNFLRQIFKEADIDGDDDLTRREMKTAFCTDRVSNKLRRLKLKEPDWMGIFDALDSDGNGTLSWNELSQGVCQMWKEAIEDDIRNHAILAAGRTQVAGAATVLDSPILKATKEPGEAPLRTTQKTLIDSKVSFATESPDAARDSSKEGSLSVSASAATMTPVGSLLTLEQSGP